MFVNLMDIGLCGCFASLWDVEMRINTSLGAPPYTT